MKADMYWRPRAAVWVCATVLYLGLAALLGYRSWRAVSEAAMFRQAERGDLSALHTLLRSGAWVDSTDRRRGSLEDAVGNYGDRAAYRQMLHRLRGRPGERERFAGVALAHAALSGWSDVAGDALDAGAGINDWAPDAWPCETFDPSTEREVRLSAACRYTALELAIKAAILGSWTPPGRDSRGAGNAHAGGATATAALLLRRGADVNMTNTLGQTPLMIAERLGSARWAVTLLRHGARVNKVDRWGGAALLYAAQSGEPAVIRTLLDAGADPRSRTARGTTAIMDAAAARSLPAVRLLLRRSPLDAAARDRAGRTGLMASLYRVPDRAPLIGTPDPQPGRSHRSPPDAPAAVAAELLAHGAPVDAADVTGRTALTWAAANGDSAAVVLLLRHGAHVNVQDKNGVTPLMRAGRSGDVTTVCFLLRGGARVNGRDHSGRTALMYGLDCPLTPRALIDLLLRAGADVGAEDNLGATVLLYARRRGDPAIYRDIASQMHAHRRGPPA